MDSIGQGRHVGSWAGGMLRPSGLKSPHSLVGRLWDAVKDHDLASACLLGDKDVSSRRAGGSYAVVVNVPRAMPDARPVYLCSDPLNETYRRSGGATVRCAGDEVLGMLSERAPGFDNVRAVWDLEASDLSKETIRMYRSFLEAASPGSPLLECGGDEFLLRIGAARRSGGRFRPTAAGLLMFGSSAMILPEYPCFSLRYIEQIDLGISCLETIETGQESWSGNLFDFFCMVLGKITFHLRLPSSSSAA